MNQGTKAKRAKSKLWLIPWAIFLIIFSAGGMFVYTFLTAAKKEVADADAGFKRAQETIDPETLRSWALENIRKKASLKEITDSMPKEIRTLYDEPPEVLVDGPSLDLSWGGGFFHWVLYIGETNETLPFNSANQEYPYNFEWRPGIYYTREANLKLQ